MPDEVTSESSPGTTEATETAATEPEQAETPAQVEEGAEPTPADDKSEPKGESVSASDAAKGSESKAEKRIKQLTAQLKTLERKLNGGQRPPEPKPKLVEPTEPTLEALDYDAGAYSTAMKKYAAELADYRGKVSAHEKAESDRKAATEKAEAELRDSWGKRVEATKKRTAEFDHEAAMATVEPTPVMDGFILDSDIGPDLLWALHEDPDEAERIRALPPYRAARELHKLELRLQDQIKGIKKPVTQAKPPGSLGTGAAPRRPKDAADVLYG